MVGRREIGDVLVHRELPLFDQHSEFFWRSGADGHLRMLVCAACGRISHPPGPRCSRCLSPDVHPQVMSGRATLVTFTVNHQPWTPGQPPYIVARVELREQPRLSLTTNLVGVDENQLTLGMDLEVVFEEGPDDIWFPLFRPDRSR